MEVVSHMDKTGALQVNYAKASISAVNEQKKDCIYKRVHQSNAPGAWVSNALL
jgi:hypothetical protein